MSHGYHVRAVTSGLEALQALRGEPFDCVLFDVLVPEMGGYPGAGAHQERLDDLQQEYLEQVDRVVAVAAAVEAESCESRVRAAWQVAEITKTDYETQQRSRA